MRLLFTVLLITVSFFKIVAQDCSNTLSGTVIDFHDGMPLVGAMVQISGDTSITYTDNEGRYQLNSLCMGSLELEVSHEACVTQFIRVDINKANTVLDVKLEHHLEELDEVKVVGDAIINKTNSAQEEVLRQQTLDQFSSQSLGDALRQLGGVSSLNTGANIVKPAIHGLNGSRVLILNNGVRMQDMEWGDEHAPNVDINSSGSISVIKGAAALQYGGDAIGGVILMEQARIPAKDTLFGKTLLNGLSNGRGGNITSELTKVFDKGWFLKGQGSYKLLGDQEAPDYILSNTGIREVGASLRFGKQLFTWGWDVNYSYYNAEIAILRASHIGNVDDLIRGINSGEPEIIRPFTYDLQNPRQEVFHHLGKLKFYKRFEGLGKLNFQYDVQVNRRFEFDVRRGESDDRASIDLELTTHTVGADFKWDAKRKSQLHVGVLGRYQDNFANPDTGVRRLIPDYEKYDLGCFLIGEYQITDKVMLDAGLRYDYTRIDAQKFYQTSRWEERGYDQEFPDFIVENAGNQILTNPVFDYHNFSATTGLQYFGGNQNVFRFNYALSQRAPNPSELFSDGLHHSAARIELGDLRIDSETSHKLSMSLERDFERWGFTLEPYVNYIRNFILLEPNGVEFTIRGAFPVWGYRQTNARLLGLDASAYVDWTDHWRSEHQFSLVKGKDMENDLALINIPAANFRNKLKFTQPEWRDFEISLESNYVFRQNEFPPNIMVFSPEQQQELLLEINTPPEAYHILALNSKIEFPLGKSTKLTTGLTINNVLNTNYRDYLNRQRFFADDLGRNFILQLKLNY
ncbi:TonB-dependent receptor [Ulvibacterium marinum]|uniref:TonB-dependent receptor n=1 Tax=Ulvibacterium marinum TaxID=2419782 RepID=A0A3B0C7A3_9FLAO|nr:TonB-dependent receptor [Ulvibacterium marinum]RKN80960.1 TonB-dependent receptor [Ulvibacterium marinum]